MATAASTPQLEVTRSGDPAATVMHVAGRLDANTFAHAWESMVEPLRSDVPKALQVNLSKLDYCDGAGLGVLAEVRRCVVTGGGKFELAEVPQSHRRLLSMSELIDPSAAALAVPAREGGVTALGRTAATLVDDLLQLITFIGQLLAVSWWMARHPRRLRWNDMLSTAQKAGADAAGVVCLLGFLVGLILAFQTAKPLAAYGVQPMIPTIVSIAVVREMGALITAIILAGRSGSAFAAEIGTMKVTEELAALRTMGLEPVQFLVVPRVMAAVLVAPLLTLCNIAMSIVGAYVVMASLGYSLSFYVNQVISSVDLSDFLGGVFKAFVFGLIIGGIGCLRGTQTQQGPGAVGDSTTRAVVSGIVLTIVADAVIGVVYFCVGI